MLQGHYDGPLGRVRSLAVAMIATLELVYIDRSAIRVKSHPRTSLGPQRSRPSRHPASPASPEMTPTLCMRQREDVPALGKLKAPLASHLSTGLQSSTLTHNGLFC